MFGHFESESGIQQMPVWRKVMQSRDATIDLVDCTDAWPIYKNIYRIARRNSRSSGTVQYSTVGIRLVESESNIAKNPS
jgi:hypothetical protein